MHHLYHFVVVKSTLVCFNRVSCSRTLLEGVLFDEGLISGVDVSFTEENTYAVIVAFYLALEILLSIIASVKNGGKRSTPGSRQSNASGQSTADQTISKIHQPTIDRHSQQKERAREQSDIVE